MTESRKTTRGVAGLATLVAAALGVAAGVVLARLRELRPSDGADGRRIREAMTPDPRAVGPQTPVVEAARLMRDEDVGSLPVVDDGRLVGIVTDRDIAVRVVASGKSAKTTTVGAIASGELVTVAPEQDLDEALRLMARHKVRRLPVVEGERLVGIVAQADVALEEDERTGAVVERISEPTEAPRA